MVDIEFKINVSEEAIKNYLIEMSRVENDCPLLYSIKEGHQRYAIKKATNKSGKQILYFEFGVSSQSAKKEDGTFMEYDEFKDIPVNWISGFEIKNASQAETISKLFSHAAELLRRKEEVDNLE